VNRADFDRFADEYRALHQRSISASGESPEYFAEYKIVDLKRIVGAGDIDTGRFLDVGAGIGASVPYFRTHFPRAHLICIDVSMRSLRIGIERCAGNGSFVAFDGRRLPFDDAAFDCVFANCVFHHIAPADQRALLQDLRRVLKRDGHVVIYEHNPLNPLTLRAVNACEFDRNARLIRAGASRRRSPPRGSGSSKPSTACSFPECCAGCRESSCR
jgi:SAM-dependent methyltransferase